MKMRKWVLGFGAILCALALCACSAPQLPEGVSEEALAQAASATIARLNDCDYEALDATMEEQMRNAVQEVDFAESWDAQREALGAYKGEKQSAYTAKDGYAVAVVEAEYENQTLTYTLSYNAALQLGGLFYK